MKILLTVLGIIGLGLFALSKLDKPNLDEEVIWW